MAKNKTLEAIVSIAGQLDPSLQKSLKGAQKQFGGLKLGMAALGTAAVAATAAVVKFGADSVKSAAEFQTQMANVSTLLNGSVDEVKARTTELSKQMLDVSNNTGVATAELSDGLYQMISAVGDSADVQKQVELAAKAASAGGAETTDAINLLSAVTKAYGDTSFDAMSKVSDLAFNTVKLGQTTFPELASSIQQVTGSSKTLGVSQEELFGVMATATGVTGQTAQVATQLKAVYTNLMKPSTGMQKALKGLGFESGQAAIQSLGLQGTLDALSESCGGNVNAMASMFSSAEALNLVLPLTGELSGALTEKTKAMTEAAGATDAAFGMQTDTLEYQIKMIKNLGKNFMTSVGMKILPKVQEVAGKVLPAVSEGLEKIGPVVDNLYSSLSPVIDIAGDFVSSILPTMNSNMQTMQNIWQQIAPTINNIATSLWPVIKGILTQVMSGMDQLRPVLETFYINLIPQIASVIQALMPVIRVVMSAVSPIVGMIVQLVSSLLPALTQIINFLIPIIQLIASVVASAMQNMVTFVMPVIQNVINVLTSLCDFIKNVFTGNWSAAWENVKSIFANCFQALVGLAKAPLNAVVSIINGVIDGINNCGFTIPDWVPVVGGKAFQLNIPKMQMFAAGGFTSGPSIAGEAGTEAVISFNNAYRDENLSYWAKAGRMLGVDDSLLTAFESGSTATGNSVSFTFSPQITINGTGSDKNDIIAAIKAEEEEFMDMVQDMLNRREEESYGYSH